MSESTESVKQSSPIVKQRYTLVRRVSGMFKGEFLNSSDVRMSHKICDSEGKSSGPPLLFRNASMQRLRHCCQNLNLFPYLLYSLRNSKSHPTVKKMHRQFVLLMQNFSLLIQSIFYTILQSKPVKNSVHFAIGFQQVLLKNLESHGLMRSYEPRVTKRSSSENLQTSPVDVEIKPIFVKFKPKERKRISLLLTTAVYLALLVLAFQLVGIISVMLFGKYPPGFIFLISALLFLGYITLKIMAYDKEGHGFKEEKRKAE